MLPFSLYLALKYLRPKRSFVSVVTVISVLGVLLGVAILVIVLSVMTGFDSMWREKILSFKPHITITSRYGILEGEEDVCRAVETLEGIIGVAPSVETRVMIQHSGRVNAPIVLGIDPGRVASISRVPDHVVSGRFDIDEENVVIGCDMAAQMGLSVGDTFLVHSPMNLLREDEILLPIEVTVAGIFDMGMREFDGGFVITSIYVAQELVGMESGAHRIYTMTDDPFQFSAYAARVRECLGEMYEVRTWQEIDRVLFDALRHEKAMMFILLVFITIVAIFCVTNTLIVITVQRTNEIGLLKALGFSTLKIMGAFVWHGWIQCLLGTVLGIGAGLLVLVNLKNIVKLLGCLNIAVFPKDIYGLSEIPWETSPRELLFIAAFVMLFCTLSSILPAYRAARMDPVEALRQE